MYPALASGGREFFGWGTDRYMLANLYDALGLLIQAAGNWKGKPPKIEPHPRPTPSAAARAPRRAPSVLELFGQFAGLGIPVTGE